MPTFIFFGSFQHYSTKVIEALHHSKNNTVLGVVTTPPHHSGNNKILTKNHTHLWADDNNLPVFTPNTLNDTSLDKIKQTVKNPPDFFLVAGYGKLIPKHWLKYPLVAPINVHFSLLPKYRGANPAEWAILMGEKETGVTLILMDEHFDTGKIIAQKKLTISPTDTRETLYTKLYNLASPLTNQIIPIYYSWITNKNNSYYRSIDSSVKLFLPPKPQKKTGYSYAPRLKRADSFIPWEQVNLALKGKNIPLEDRSEILRKLPEPWPLVFERFVRATSGFPDTWTIIPTKKGQKRLKLLSVHLKNNQITFDQVQLESKSPSTFNQLKSLL